MMMRLFSRWLWLPAFFSLALTLMLLAAACATSRPTTSAALNTENMTATAFCIYLTDTGETVALWELYGTPTPLPGVTPPTPTPRFLPISGDAKRGKEIFHGTANCATCHRVDTEETFVGPSLKTIANRAGYKRLNMDAKTYLYNVIVNPDLNIIPLTKPGIMPRTFEKQLTQQDIADIIAYLLTLKA
ncbi:MAG TPA: cytochrome c [Phototrophicaceae bacterium]|nr:cytochrome c [Phototrophicaceae bacterium]